jgi:hypothetical protein
MDIAELFASFGRFELSVAEPAYFAMINRFVLPYRLKHQLPFTPTFWLSRSELHEFVVDEESS